MRNYEYNSREEERALLRLTPLDKAARKIDARLLDPPSLNSSAQNHALDGVRVNGTQKPITVRDAHLALIRFKDEIKEHLDVVKRRLSRDAPNSRAGRRGDGGASNLRVVRRGEGLWRVGTV